jgi:hypothetical protein
MLCGLGAFKKEMNAHEICRWRRVVTVTPRMDTDLLANDRMRELGPKLELGDRCRAYPECSQNLYIAEEEIAA